MPFVSIASVGLGLAPGVNYFTAPPFGLYAEMFQAGTGFLASIDGTATSYPHRAIVFRAESLYSVMPRLLLSQGSTTTYLEFYQQRLATDADTMPTTNAPVSGYRVTSQVTSAVLSQLAVAACGCAGLRVYVDTNPTLDDFSAPMSLGAAIADAIRQLANGGGPTITIYYESASAVYSALFTVTAVTLTPP